MAANMKAVKLRIKSIQNTMQITKAMELVAASKLKKAKDKAVAVGPCFEMLKNMLTQVAEENWDFSSVYSRPNYSDTELYIVIAGDRGLAGGYNSNQFKLFEKISAGKKYQVLPIGKKSLEYFERKAAKIFTKEFSNVAEVSISDCYEISKMISEEYKKGTFGHVTLCYTTFVTMLTQEADMITMLPLSGFKRKENQQKSKQITLYDPDSETVFNSIVPEYLSSMIYIGVCESIASELAARRTAMDSATKNAGEMIEKLELFYNRARQAGITQEITEIVAGSEGV